MKIRKGIIHGLTISDSKWSSSDSSGPTSWSNLTIADRRQYRFDDGVWRLSSISYIELFPKMNLWQSVTQTTSYWDTYRNGLRIHGGNSQHDCTCRERSHHNLNRTNTNTIFIRLGLSLGNINKRVDPPDWPKTRINALHGGYLYLNVL